MLTKIPKTLWINTDKYAYDWIWLAEIDESDYFQQDVYNAHETPQFVGAFPEKPVTSLKHKKSASRQEMSEDRVTAMACTNAGVTHAPKNSLIVKCARPRYIKNIKFLLVIHKSHKSTWINVDMFL